METRDPFLIPPKAVKIVCPTCQGDGRQPVAWQITGEVEAFGPCATCLKQGWVLANARQDALCPV